VFPVRYGLKLYIFRRASGFKMLMVLILCCVDFFILRNFEIVKDLAERKDDDGFMQNA
jgi:hypothetical protein